MQQAGGHMPLDLEAHHFLATLGQRDRLRLGVACYDARGVPRSVGERVQKV